MIQTLCSTLDLRHRGEDDRKLAREPSRLPPLHAYSTRDRFTEEPLDGVELREKKKLDQREGLAGEGVR